MLDNDANLLEANEDKVDKKLPENEVQSETDVTEPDQSTEDEWQESPDTPQQEDCLLYTSPSPRDRTRSRMPSSA